MDDEHAPLAPPPLKQVVVAEAEPVRSLGARERGEPAAGRDGADEAGGGATGARWPSDPAQPKDLGSRFPRNRGRRRRTPLWR
jgi:hypothetical protein